MLVFKKGIVKYLKNELSYLVLGNSDFCCFRGEISLGIEKNRMWKEMICNFIFQSDCQVHLQPQIIPPNMEEYMNSLLTAVLPSVLNKFRIYLSLLRLLDYSISEEVTKVWKTSLSCFQLYVQIESTLTESCCTFPLLCQ